MNKKPLVYCFIATTLVAPFFGHEHPDDTPYVYYDYIPVLNSSVMVGTTSLLSSPSIYYIGTTSYSTVMP